MLPLTLIVLIASVVAQRQQLDVNRVLDQQLDPTNSSGIPFVIPPQLPNTRLVLSISLCSNRLPTPRFFLSSNDSEAIDTGQNGKELVLNAGLGIWNLTLPRGGIISAFPGQLVPGVVYPPWPFQIAVSDVGVALHEPLENVPLLGDTTSTQALVFSPAAGPYKFPEPTFPNYTFSPPNITYPDPPQALPNYTLALFLSAQSPILSRSACSVRQAFSESPVFEGSPNTTIVSRGPEGFRTQWIVGGLQPGLNYSAYVLRENQRISPPMFFQMKQRDFPCALIHSLPFCPLTAYSTPLPPPASPQTSYTAANLDKSITTPLFSSLSNFSSTLSVFACGRDMYSPVKTCTDCYSTYRNWLCAVAFPQCADTPPNPQSFSSPSPEGTPPTPALLVQPGGTTRSPILPPLATSHTVVLPCIEGCQAVDRACPPLVKWKCPLAEVNANWTYGVGFIDGLGGEEKEGRVGGLVSGGVDRWGGTWCSGL